MSYKGIEEFEYGNAMESSWTIIKGLRESLLNMTSLYKYSDKPKLNEWRDIEVEFKDDGYGGILEDSVLFTAVMDIMARQTIDKIGSFSEILDVNMHALQLLRYTESTSIIRARVSYSKKKTEFVDDNNNEDAQSFLFILKDNPDLALDVIDGDVGNERIAYTSLVPHNGMFNDIQVFPPEVLPEFNLDAFWAIPVNYDEEVTLKDIFNYIGGESGK